MCSESLLYLPLGLIFRQPHANLISVPAAYVD